MEQGHNSGERLKSFIERIEKLQDEKDAISLDIKEIYLEVKSSGYDAKILKRLIALKAKTEQSRKEEAELLSLYASAVQLDLGF